MRPLIGISCRTSNHAKSGRAITYNHDAYIHAVEHAGGLPVLIPVLQDLSDLQEFLSHLDGLLLPGGSDIHSQHYQEQPHVQAGKSNLQLDEMELVLARWSHENNIPTLGICRGMQVINVALGGTLYQDLPSEYTSNLFHANWDAPRHHIIHTVKIETGSQMGKILGVHEVPVNSLHHQAIKVPGTGIRISGYAEDGIVELIEVPAHRFMLAVQCHPEELYTNHPVWKRLFDAFINAASIKVQQIPETRKSELLAS